MLWPFVILGIIGLASALNAAAAAIHQRRSIKSEWAALALLAAAWLIGHDRVVGWAALTLALAIEIARRLPRSAGSTSDTSGKKLDPLGVPRPEESLPQHEAPSASQAPVAPPTLLPVSPTPNEVLRESPKPTRRMQSCLLLKAPSNLSHQVVVASLRRAGERRATLVESKAGPHGSTIRVGNLDVVVESHSRAILPDEVAAAAAQSWDWPEAAAEAARHSAHVTITTTSTTLGEASPAEILRLHVMLQHALFEFVQIVGAFWPAAQRLIRADQIAALTRQTDDFELAKSTCLTFRVFPMADPDEGRFLSDVVGLHAFGLPDAQVITDAEPDASTSELLYRAARESFSRNSPVDALIESDENVRSHWTVNRVAATFPPDREVVRFEKPVESPPA